MKKTAVFETAIAELVEVANNGADKHRNPYLTIAKFVFADDQGNSNNQGIEVEDFDAVIETATDMPVKMNFTGSGVANHVGSYVVGHINKMEKIQAADGSNQLVAWAVLYAEEYPEEIQWLKDAYAAGEAPGVSYEMAYSDSVVKNGIQWLKNVITCAATFVRTPAYGKRTALLALASAKNDTELIEAMKAFVAQAEEVPSGEGINPNNKGGNSVDELEQAKQEAAQYKTEAETKTAEITRLNEELTAAKEEISTLKEANATLEREKVLASRLEKFTQAGFKLEADAEKADKKKAFWLSLNDEAFDAYIEDLVDAKKSATTDSPLSMAAASLRTTAVPRLDPADDDSGLTFRFRE
jgi:hypothetical protein